MEESESENLKKSYIIARAIKRSLSLVPSLLKCVLFDNRQPPSSTPFYLQPHTFNCAFSSHNYYQSTNRFFAIPLHTRPILPVQLEQIEVSN